MNLTLVVGPPNAGRAGVIRKRFTEALPSQPILVVPTGDDISRFERELCDREGTVVGGAVMSFKRLFETVATATGCEQRPLLSGSQRRRLIAKAVEQTNLKLLAATANHPGFVAGLDQLFAEMQSAAVNPEAGIPAPADPDQLDPDEPYLAEILGLLGAYARLRDQGGWGDQYWLATSALARLQQAPELWGSRPVLIYGFDDLDPQQMKLVAALARATAVTVAVTFEDREALKARATLLSELNGLDPDSRPERIDLPPNQEHTESETLFHLEREFGAARPRPAAADGCLKLIEAGGARSEVEQVVSGVARALADGADPERVAVVLRSPSRYAGLYAQALDQASIPHAIHASIPLAQTAIGHALLSLLRACSNQGSVDELLAFMRYPGLLPSDQVDWFERGARRARTTDVTEAIAEHWRGRDLWELDNIGKADNPAAACLALAKTARDASSWRLHGKAPRVDPSLILELQAAQQIANDATELAALGVGAPGLAELTAMLAEAEVLMHKGSVAGRVQVLSPYRLRAGRFSHVFVGALQEGEFPASGGGSPFLSDGQRGRLGLAARAEPESEERYLFYVCLASPTTELVLSSRYADEDGKAESRSPFVEEICELLSPEPVAVRRDPATVVPVPADAIDPGSLARSLAALPGGAAAAEAAAESISWHDAVEPGLIARAATLARTPPPKDLSDPTVLGQLGQLATGGASTLEDYATCSYRWFVNHELRPREITPQADHLSQGSALHMALERLFGDPPPGGPKPTGITVGAWIERGHELLDETAEELGIGPYDGNRRAGLARMQTLLAGYLTRESRRGWSLDPDPALLEFEFGPEAEYRGPQIAPGFELRGKIDRVDLVPGEGPRAALIRDYKSGSKVPARKEILERGKLQIPLYATALEHALGHIPLGGLYEALGARDKGKPRGLVSEAAITGPIPADGLVKTDVASAEDFELELDAARNRAAEIVEAMRTGKIDRNPLDGECPRYCNFQAVCRRERSQLGEGTDLGDGDGGEG